MKKVILPRTYEKVLSYLKIFKGLLKIIQKDKQNEDLPGSEYDMQ